MLCLGIKNKKISNKFPHLQRNIKDRMNFLSFKKMFNIWSKKTTFLRIMNKNMGGIYMLTLKLTEGTCWVYENIDIRFTDGTPLANSMP